MKAHVNFNGQLSEELAVDNGVKKGDIPALTLFSIFFAVLLSYAFQDYDKCVPLRFRTTGNVFNLRRFNAKSKTIYCMQMMPTFWLTQKKICNTSWTGSRMHALFSD